MQLQVQTRWELRECFRRCAEHSQEEILADCDLTTARKAILFAGRVDDYEVVRSVTSEAFDA